jgi:hypothetical protein
MKIGDKVKVKQIKALWPSDEALKLVGKTGKIVGIAPETCAGLPCCPYDVRIDGEVYFMDANELEVIK